MPLISICIANPASLYSYSRCCESANLLSATANQASGHGIQTGIRGHVQDSSSISTLPPRSLSWNGFVGSWNIFFNSWEAFPPSSTTAKAISDMYASILNTLIRNQSEITPTKILSFTYGGLRLTCQGIGQAIPWSAIEGFLKVIMGLTSAGRTGLYTVAFYILKGSIIWSAVLIILVLMANTRQGVSQNLVT